MLNIKEDRLQEVLLSKKKYIRSYGDITTVTISLIGYAITLFTSDLKSQSLFFKITIGCFSVFILVASLITLFHSFYSIDRLKADIEAAAEKTHNFSLIILKDSSGKFVKHFLTKKDPRWKCYLFPYIRSSESDKKDIIALLNNMGFLNPKSGKTLEENFTKYSVSAGVTKSYHHTFYEFSVNCSDSKFKKEFKYNGIKYKWMTYEEMKTHKRTYIHNSDHINFVSNNF